MKKTFLWKLAGACLLASGLADNMAAQEVAETSLPATPEPHTAVQCDEWIGAGASQSATWGFRGWISGGIFANNHSPASRFNGLYNQTDFDGGMLNQIYAIAEKPVENSTSDTIGGRLDVLYGRDFILAQSFGLEINPDGSGGWNNQSLGIAIPQAYVSMGNRDAHLKVGHFYTLVGYEGVPAPVNFFYSKSNSYMFAGPFTHWGTVGTWAISDNLTVDAGLVNGWNGFDRVSDSVSFLNRVTLGSDAIGTKLSFGIITGNEANQAATATSNRTRYSVILAQNLGERAQYVAHQWLGSQDQFFANGSSAAWYGLDQYLFYTLRDRLKAGVRLEWFKDQDGVRLGLNRPTNPNKPPYIGDMYSLSTGLNWQSTRSLTIRPEVRYDWFTGSGNPFNDNASKSQFVGGLDATWLF